MDRGGGRFGRFGRGRGGRGFGGRGMHRNEYSNSNSSKKVILNFPIGSSPSPGDVQRWMCDFALLAAIQCPKSGVAKIIKDDGTIADNYIEREEPETPDPDDPDIEFLRIRYSNAAKIYDNLVEDMNQEKRTMVALIKSHLGADSIARVRETEAGRQAIEDDDPRNLLLQIYAAHNTDHLLENEQNVVIAERKLRSVQQGDKEETAVYFNRFKALVQAARNALLNNGDDPDARMPSEANLAVMFIIGLHSGYRRFKSSFTDGTNEEGYPETLADAYRRALKASVEMISYKFVHPAHYMRGAFVAGRGSYVPPRFQGRGNHGGGGRGRGRGYGRGNYNRPGRGREPRLCYVCRQPGHLAAQCPHRDDAVIDEAVENMNGGNNNHRGGNDA